MERLPPRMVTHGTTQVIFFKDLPVEQHDLFMKSAAGKTTNTVGAAYRRWFQAWESDRSLTCDVSVAL